ncbi:MAG TPA: cytochrome C oxidase subunit IV family protein [Blastocatellia bacterium]|nr:cytochrome C oxidase subunit IV family protein [Blastocatellia bacterium]
MAEHIVSRKIYLTIFGALIVLTILTIVIAGVDLGPLNTVVALAIAAMKATLVALFFMHVRYSSRLTQVVVVSGLFWLCIMFALTMSDYLTRDWVAYSR